MFVEIDKETYGRHNIVESLIGWLKECRRILTRFEKRVRFPWDARMGIQSTVLENDGEDNVF